MNIATQALATSEVEGSARRSGRMRSVVAAGPFLGLVVGAVLDQLAVRARDGLDQAAQADDQERAHPEHTQPNDGQPDGRRYG